MSQLARGKNHRHHARHRALGLADIPVKIVLGVTSASGAAAGQSLTERDMIDTVIQTAGHFSNGCTIPDAIRSLVPGSCVALYMAVKAAPEICTHLSLHPLVDDMVITIVANAQKASQIVVEWDVSSLPETLEEYEITKTATILLKLRKHLPQKHLYNSYRGPTSNGFDLITASFNHTASLGRSGRTVRVIC